jgi:hypothetical protein
MSASSSPNPLLGAGAAGALLSYVVPLIHTKSLRRKRRKEEVFK